MAVTSLGWALLAAPADADVRAREVSRQAGIHQHNHTWGAYVHDVDGNGLEDVLLNVHYGGPSKLYLNSGDRFRRTNRDAFPVRDRHDCDFADVDGDGLLDIYCTVGGKKGGTGPNSNELWIQRRDGSFVNRAGAYRAKDLFGRGRDTTFIDVDRDGRPDLFVGNAIPRKDGRKGLNKLMLNQGGRRFKNAPRYRVNRAVGGETVEAVDFDRDGFDDLLVCGKGRLHLYRNLGGRRFRDVSRRKEVDGRCEDTAMVDVDGDGRPDLVRLVPNRLTVKRQTRRGFRQTLYGRKLRRGHALASGDINGDGRPDLYVVQSGDRGRDKPDVMLRNRSQRRRGKAFTGVRIPQTRRGSGDSVAAIDHDDNGLTDFIVMNGRRFVEGPVRLIAFFPR